MPDKCLDCPAPSADMDGFIVSGPGGAPRSEGSGVSSPEGPFVREAPQTGHVVIMGTLGADGNPGALPDAPQVGWAYVAEDAGEYGGVYATEGDTVYCKSLNPARWGIWQSDSDDSGRDLVSVSASFGCGEKLEQFSPYSPQSCRFYGYDYAGETPVEHVGMDYDLSSSTISFRWLDDDARHVIVEPDGVPVDVDTIAIIDAPAGSVYEGSSAGRIMRLELVSRTHDAASAVYVFSLSSVPLGSVLSLTSATASGGTSVQEVDMSCLDDRLVSVSASFDCGSMQNYAPYGPAAEIVVYDSGGSVLGRSNLISAPGGLLEVPPLQDVSWQLVAPDFSAAAFVSVWFTSAERSGDAFSVYEAKVSPASWEALAAGAVLSCETSCSVDCLGPERCELEVVSAPVSGGRTFQIRASYGPALSLASAAASGESSVQTVDMSCLVSPVFDGTENGLVPASGAVQNYLLAGNGTWMRPATNAEIDAIFGIDS